MDEEYIKILKEAYKWLKISELTDDEELKQEYERISKRYFNMYLNYEKESEVINMSELLTFCY